jgi:phosphoribosylaminoimidazole-succinocarboxamide synthase
MPNGIPRKGEVLTQISHFWFEKFAALVPNHLLARANDPLPKNLQPFAAQLARRSMIVKKAKPLAIECIVRGYLSGSGWKEYKKSQTVCGIKLPAGLTESAELPEPIFTPSTKAEAGHDENISFAEAQNRRRGTRHAGARPEPEDLPGRTRLRPPARHHHRRHEIRVRPVRRQIDPD